MTPPWLDRNPIGQALLSRRTGSDTRHFRPTGGHRESPQKAGIQWQNQYVAARNRFAGLGDVHVLIGPGPEHQEKQL
jgi:hypothetical protein